MCWETPPMPARTQNASQHVLTNMPAKTKLIVCWPNSFHESQETNCISTCVDLIYPKPAKTQNSIKHVLKKKPLPMAVSTQNVSQFVLTKPCHARTDRKSVATYVDQMPPVLAITKIISPLVLTKFLPCKRGHRMYPNLSWLNSSYAREDTKWILKYAAQGLNMPARKYKIHLNMCWPNPSHDSEDKMYLTKLLPRQWGHKIHLIMFWQNPSHASQDKTWFSTCVD